MNLTKFLLRKNPNDNKNPFLLEAMIALKDGDKSKGIDLLYLAGSQGESNAFLILGFLLEDDKFYSRSLQMGNPVGAYHLGRIYFERGELGIAKDHFEFALSQGVIQSLSYLERCEDEKLIEKLWFILWGPLFLLKRGEYRASFWSFSLLTIVSLMSFKSITIMSFLISYIFINFIFSDSFEKSIS